MELKLQTGTTTVEITDYPSEIEPHRLVAEIAMAIADKFGEGWQDRHLGALFRALKCFFADTGVSESAFNNCPYLAEGRA